MRPLEIHSTSLSLSYFICKMEKLPLGLSWRSSLIRNSQVFCQGKRYCRVLLCSHSYDLPLGHYLSFCCVFCNMFCLIFSGSFHLSTQEESVSLGCDPESCDLWFCAISSTSNGLPYSSVTFRKWNENKKAILFTWILALLQGSYLLWWKWVFWVLDPDFPGGLQVSGAYGPEDAK